jgi:hypothetical protein
LRAANPAHGEISVANARRAQAAAGTVSASVTMAGPAPWENCRVAVDKILIECRLVEFEENLPRIRVELAAKRRNNANDSFSPVC